MSTTRLFRTGVLTLGLLVGLWGYGWAVPPSTAAEQSYSDANAAPSGTVAATASNDQTLKRASKVLHARVKSPDGKTLGRVHDLVLAPDLNSIDYVAVSSGGILGVGDTLHAIPWSDLTESLNGTYVISMSEQEFKQSPSFRSSNWPTSAENIGVSSRSDTTARIRAADADVQGRRFTHIRNSTVRAAEGKRAGRVQDLVIVMDTGRIPYTIVSYGGIAGLGARLAAVPQSAVTLEPSRQVARVNATPEAIHANSFTPNRWPDLSSSTFAREVDQAFGGQTTQTALGYVPAEGTAVAAAPSAKTPAKPSPRSTTPPSSRAKSATTPASGAEPAPGDLTGTFDPAKATSIDGTVIDQGKFKASVTGPDMLWLRVRTTDDRTVLVNLGPRSYIGNQNFYVVPGDRIHLSGSEVTAATQGRQVFLPAEVTYENETLRLRSSTGTPLWEGQGAATPGQQPGAKTPSTSSTPSTSTPSTSSPPQSRSGTSENPPLGYVPGQKPDAADQSTNSSASTAQTSKPGATRDSQRTTPRIATEPNEPNEP